MEELRKKVRNQKLKNKKAIENGKTPKVYDLIQEIDENEKEYAEGEQFTTCQKCGSMFEQDYRADINTYSNYKTCHKCRRSNAKKRVETKQDETSVAKLLYSPYPWQQNFEKTFAQTRFGVICGGARSGKDFMCVMLIIKYVAMLYNEFRIINKPHLVPSFRVWIIAPVEKIARQNWQQLTKFFPKDWVISVSDSTMTMQVIGGGIIEVRSAYEPEHLVGVAVDFCVITEAARIRDLKEVWDNIEDRLNSQDVGLEGKGGKAIINSSPLGKNYFYEMFCWGQKTSSKYSSRFFSVQVPTTANPAMAKRYAEFIQVKNGNYHKVSEHNYVKVGESYTNAKGETITVDFGEYTTYGEDLKRRKGKKFLQDNLAQFISAGGTAFENFRENCVIDVFTEYAHKSKSEIKEIIKQKKMPEIGKSYTIGYDPATGSSGDTPALIVKENVTNIIKNVISLYGHENDAQWDKVAYWSRYYNNATVHCLIAGYLTVPSQLRKRGIDVVEISELGQGKRNLVQSLQAIVQNGDLTVYDDGTEEVETFIRQMEDYAENSNGKFSNNVEENDDFVTALYACCSDYLKVVEIKKQYTGFLRGRGRLGKTGIRR